MKNIIVSCATLFCACASMSLVCAQTNINITRITVSDIKGSPGYQSVWIYGTPYPNRTTYFQSSTNLVTWSNVGGGFNVNQWGGVMSLNIIVSRNDEPRMYFRAIAP